MPSYTLAELTSQSTTRAGRRADISLSDSSFMVNTAYQQVASLIPDAMQEQKAISSTTSGENKITLPTDFGEIINLSYYTTKSDSGKTLRMMTPSQYDEVGTHPLGKPHSFVLFRDWFELFPSPNSAWSLQIRYRSNVTDMTELTDIPSIHTDARLAVLYLSIAEHWGFVNEPTQRALAEQKAYNYITTVKNKFARRQHASDRYGAIPTAPEVRQVSKRSFDIV